MRKLKKKAFINKSCVACGACMKCCPKGAISIYKGLTAVVDKENCVGCGKCVKVCPAMAIVVKGDEENEK